MVMFLRIIQSPSSIVRGLWEEVFTYSNFWPEPWGGKFPAWWHPAPTTSDWRLLLLLHFTDEILPPDGSDLCSGNGHFTGKAEDSLYSLWTFPSLLPHHALCTPTTAPRGQHWGRGSSMARQAGRAGCPGQGCWHAPECLVQQG